jgi:hypothetical protein
MCRINPHPKVPRDHVGSMYRHFPQVLRGGNDPRAILDKM